MRHIVAHSVFFEAVHHKRAVALREMRKNENDEEQAGLDLLRHLHRAEHNLHERLANERPDADGANDLPLHQLHL